MEPMGKVFIIMYVLCGLGFFCGPLLDITSSWMNHVPGGITTVTIVTVGIGVILFNHLEDISPSDAIYASVIVGKFMSNELGFNRILIFQNCT